MLLFTKSSHASAIYDILFVIFSERQSTMKRLSKGTIYVLAAAVLFSIGGLCIKMIPWNPLAINGARNLIAAALIGAYIKSQGHRLQLVIKCQLPQE